ncbi:MAG TPA: arginase family protein [Caulobacterales bacterium]|nr:arginase family protein [Caulobacterales bacterium]
MREDSDCRSWRSAADLLGADAAAPIAVLGAPLAEGSLTPGRCDLAPAALRAALQRMSVYDLETEADLSPLRVFDAGDLDLKQLSPADAFAPIEARMRELTSKHGLTLLIGGNNAVTRPAAHALGSLRSVGVLTLDAHFDLRDTDCGLTNGNPIQALLEDGLPGANIAQLGLLPFANTRRAHEKAKAAGIHVVTARQCRAWGLARAAAEALSYLAARTERIHVDFDIDVIARSQLPGAPGARPGGVEAQDFFDAARVVAAHPRVASVDLAELDPSLDVGQVSALTAARWFCEVLAGYQRRG